MNDFCNWEGCLVHHGIKGQKWGVRRYQNEDGTLTTLGKMHAGKEGRAENRALKKTISDDKKLSKEWRKERNRAVKRAVKDEGYQNSIADLEAHRLNMDPKETREFFDAHLAGERAADNMMWYKYGDRGYKNITKKIDSGEKIAKTILKKLEKKGLDVAANGRRWQEGLERENSEKKSGKNAFEGRNAKSTLALLQEQRDIEKREKKLEKLRKNTNFYGEQVNIQASRLAEQLKDGTPKYIQDLTKKALDQDTKNYSKYKRKLDKKNKRMRRP